MLHDRHANMMPMLNGCLNSWPTLVCCMMVFSMLCSWSGSIGASLLYTKQNLLYFYRVQQQLQAFHKNLILHWPFVWVRFPSPVQNPGDVFNWDLSHSILKTLQPWIHLLHFCLFSFNDLFYNLVAKKKPNNLFINQCFLLSAAIFYSLDIEVCKILSSLAAW